MYYVCVSMGVSSVRMQALKSACLAAPLSLALGPRADYFINPVKPYCYKTSLCLSFLI